MQLNLSKVFSDLIILVNVRYFVIKDRSEGLHFEKLNESVFC